MDKKDDFSLTLAKNIRFHRQRLGLTQKALADKLFVTPQNVSKWEKGQSLPSVQLLFGLSGCFGISLDRLTAGKDERSEKVFLAIDGGGTKTVFCLFSESGEVLSLITLPGTNPNSCGIEKTKAILSDGINETLSGISEVSMIYAGIAGCGSEEWKKSVFSHIRRLCPYCKVEVSSDVPSVIAASPIGGDFIAVICGTGSVIYAKEGCRLTKFGGFGYLFDDDLNAYSLGRAAISEALAYESGISGRSILSDLVRLQFGGDLSSGISRLYAMGKDFIAHFSHAVFEAYDLGDEKAADIIGRVSENTAKLLNKVSESFDCGNKVVISGGLTSRKDILGKFLGEKTGGKFDFIFCDFPQIYGAVIHCAELYAKELPDEKFKNRILSEIGGNKR